MKLDELLPSNEIVKPLSGDLYSCLSLLLRTPALQRHNQSVSVSNNSSELENYYVKRFSAEASALSLFRVGAIVLLTLGTPREKFWGALLELNLAGIGIRGISLASVDDCIQQLRAEERVDATAVFFPLHRVERMELDARSGELPSIGERFESQTGIAPATFFGAAEVQR